MIIRPSREKPDHFILDVSSQELQNILEAFENTNPPWKWNSPWGKGTIQQFKDAIEAGKKYYFRTSW